ncbi:Cyclin-D3-2 [Striga hermonthica]|uniref:Cyclin-D3-2 n=1 Tax=Striga hermonthica TaxID=68872 RepID=A0A9N7NL92_STRHE|nr:Cyclin-D3-2 [Striga hermonthica]
MFPHLPNPIFDAALYCEEEERFDDDGFVSKDPQTNDLDQIQKTPFALFEHDLFWEDDELACLLSEEKKQLRLFHDAIKSDGCLKTSRDEAVKWMLKVVGHYGFGALTAVLAVDYFDRFIASICFQRDKPWMGQLAAVACLSIAAKMDETQVPLLLDLQVEESKYLFEAKTIQRMELLVLSTLKWKMNPVTPMSYFDHIARRFGLIKNLHWEFLRTCEGVILSIITDCRLGHYAPSTIACATMIHVIREIENDDDYLDFEGRIANLLETSKDKIDDCCKLIMEASDDNPRGRLCIKRKHSSMPCSPSGVIDAYFSSDSSVDSWAIGSSMSPSPEPVFKRSRAHDQHMRLAPLSSESGWHA